MHKLVDKLNYEQVQAALPRPPYYRFLANHGQMAALLQLLVPRLSDSFASSALEWYLLYACSLISNYVGGRYAASLAYQAALNSKSFIHSTVEEQSFFYCASYHEKSYLQDLLRLSRAVGRDGYSNTCYLVERAFQHGDKMLLSRAIDRLSFYEEFTWETGHPILEYKVASARYEHLCGETIKEEQLVTLIREHGNKYHKKIYLHELCSFVPVTPEVVSAMSLIAENSPEEQLEPEQLETARITAKDDAVESQDAPGIG